MASTCPGLLSALGICLATGCGGAFHSLSMWDEGGPQGCLIAECSSLRLWTLKPSHDPHGYEVLDAECSGGMGAQLQGTASLSVLSPPARSPHSPLHSSDSTGLLQPCS